MICGFAKSSFVDYPNQICSTIFVGTCNFRCPYCHNPGLVFGKEKEISQDEIVAYLEKRKGIIEAVCITGGEPTLWPGLIDFIKLLKARGLKVKLDTNGSFPNVIKQVIDEKLVDYIAMDIKAPLEKYSIVTKSDLPSENIAESVKLIIAHSKKAGIDYEFRTTVHSALLTKNDLEKIGEELTGATKYILQEFKSRDELLDNHLAATNVITKDDLEKIADKIREKNIIQKIVVR